MVWIEITKTDAKRLLEGNKDVAIKKAIETLERELKFQKDLAVSERVAKNRYARENKILKKELETLKKSKVGEEEYLKVKNELDTIRTILGGKS